MENCLVTKLKSTVENDNLPYLGYLKFVLKGETNTILSVMGTGTIKFIGGKYNGNNTLEMVDGVTYYLGHNTEFNTVIPDIPGGDVTILIPKYTIVKLNDYGLGTPFSLEELEYSTLLAKLLLSGGNIIGKLSDIVGLSNLDSLSLSSSGNVTGDISVLSTMPNLVKIDFTGVTALSGNAATLGKLALTALVVPFTKNVDFSVEAFVGYNRTAGRTTGSINLKYIGKCNSTFNGAAVPDIDVDNQLSWDATTITFRGTTITA